MTYRDSMIRAFPELAAIAFESDTKLIEAARATNDPVLLALADMVQAQWQANLAHDALCDALCRVWRARNALGEARCATQSARA